MIRKYNSNDLDSVLEIWLEASVKAHDFVPADFWGSQVESMRNIYIPASEVIVYEIESKIVGFYALYESTLAAIFVFPEFQGKGIGKQLLSHAKAQRAILSLSVYKENQASYQFYLSQGFAVVSEQLDEHTGHPEYTMSSGT
ncbi:N-acetyltransferase [Vibrio parahaemolyticus]|uniref:N-acetyltransferase n=1 Tax=Vibrio parahaemolyticus TaxID=670 RepID=UPI00044EFF38|nr:N-acetyltransferase [Vibrio parahaemolyticus]EXJ25647.1 acetyltransferase family protein [Vibrio parahaemolyticus VPCR-2009]MBE3775491.1 N-acetyltransferase [Vibrio parahaemolyticus]MBE4300672.1 N-acetyltransferase [Vibrio parahaemolyticus]MBE4305107.1 N-acetyltransferase [Vibrio parahaemolyticus]MBE4463054.1 N-acetyltransferase [Vibrio parahaemolyticus]